MQIHAFFEYDRKEVKSYAFLHITYILDIFTLLNFPRLYKI